MISSNLLFSSSEALELADQLREDLPILGEIDSPVAHNSTCEQPPAPPGYLKLIYEFLVKLFQPANTSDSLTNLTESQLFDFELDAFDDPARPLHPNASDGGVDGLTFATRVASSTQSVIDLPDSVSNPNLGLLAAVPDIDNVTDQVPVNHTSPKGEEVDPFVGVIEDTSDIFTRFSTWFDHQLEAYPYLSLVLVMVSLLVCYVWLCWLSTHYLLSSYTPVQDAENPPPARGNGGDAPSAAAGADPQPQPPASPDLQPPGEIDHRPGPDAAAMPLRNFTRSAPSLRILDEVGPGQPLPVPSVTSSPPSTPSSHTYISIPSLPPSPRVPLRPLGCFNGHRPISLELNTNHTGSHQVSTGVRCTAV